MANQRICKRWLLFFVVLSSNLQAITCIFNNKINTSDNPFASCLMGTDTIIIKDTLVLDVDYEPIINGLPFDRILIVDSGVLFWTSNVRFSLGTNARILLCGTGHLYPNNTSDIFCNTQKSIYFDVFKLASCDGSNASFSFSTVNKARCLDGMGLCTPGCLALSIAPSAADRGWQLFPNPVSETLQVLSDNSALAYLRIFDSTGRLIFEKTTWLSSAEPIEIQEVASFQNGILSLEILTMEGRPLFAKRFLKTSE